MKKYIFLVCLMWVPVLALAQSLNTVSASVADEVIPTFFKNKTEAMKSHCFFEPLKSKDGLNCIFTSVERLHEFLIGVYDSDEKGGWVLKNVLQITSWDGEAKVDFQDLLGTGTKFMKVVFEGNTGSDEKQKVLMYAGWNEKHFVPVLMETLSYDVKLPEGDEYGRHLNLTTELKSIGNESVQMDLNYRFSKNEPNGQKLNCEWIDKLHWNKNSFSFYNEKTEEAGLLNSKCDVESNVRQSRLKFLKKRPGLKTLEVNDLEKLGMVNF